MTADSESRLSRPEIGWLGKRLGPFRITGVFWVRLHLIALRLFPSWVWRILVPLSTAGFFLTLVRIRRALAANLVAVLGPCGFLERQRRIFRTFLSLAWCLMERYEQYSGVRHCETTEEGRDHWNRAVHSEDGVILVTAHIGAWDSGSLLPSPLARRRVHVVREMEADPRSQAIIRNVVQQQAGDLYTIHFAGSEPGLGVQLLEALRAGEFVALQGDRPAEKGKTVEATLFGRPFLLPKGPLALARAAEVDLLPVYILREHRLLYKVVFRPPITVQRNRDRDRDLSEAARELAAGIEWAIRAKPHQWFCWNVLWPDPGDGSRTRLGK